jgi:hypothetical protein
MIYRASRKMAIKNSNRETLPDNCLSLRRLSLESDIRGHSFSKTVRRDRPGLSKGLFTPLHDVDRLPVSVLPVQGAGTDIKTVLQTERIFRADRGLLSRHIHGSGKAGHRRFPGAPGVQGRSGRQVTG